MYEPFPSNSAIKGETGTMKLASLIAFVPVRSSREGYSMFLVSFRNELALGVTRHDTYPGIVGSLRCTSWAILVPSFQAPTSEICAVMIRWLCQ